MITQVDEFWAIGNRTAHKSGDGPMAPLRREGALSRLGDYLNEETTSKAEKPNEASPKPEETPEKTNPDRGTKATGPEFISDPINDPYGIFKGPPRMTESARDSAQPWRRRDYFRRSLPDELRLGGPEIGETERRQILTQIDRAPFAWDFGFLLCPKTMWEKTEIRDREFIDEKGNVEKAGNVWDAMRKADTPEDTSELPIVPWRRFLAACKAVSDAYSKHSSASIVPFDVSTLAPESILCLVLEVWASEIVDLMQTDKDKEDFCRRLGKLGWKPVWRQAFVPVLLIVARHVANDNLIPFGAGESKRP